ncbi:restriction endonuclease subunit S [Enorma massiliensis]|uniref:restriction endonuclease subunit S n=1 Tax=Enorma massiliensis TaxID=1472761 RepID=UPI003AEF1863
MMLRIPIPEGWGEAPLKDVVTFCTDYLPENTSPDFSFRYVDIGSVEHGKGITRFQEMSFSEAPSRARKRVRRGDTIVSTVRTYLKAIAHVDEDENFIVSTGFSVLRPKTMYPRYLTYLMESDFVCDEIDKLSWGVSYPAISESLMGCIHVPIPPFSEQKNITKELVEELGTIDEASDALEQQVRALGRYRSSLINEAVTKGLNPNVPMKPSGVEWMGYIPSEWSITKLKYIARTCNGLDYDSEDVCSPDDAGAALVVRSSNISNGEMVHADDVFVNTKIPDSVRLRKDDLVIVRANGSPALVGKSALFSLDGSCVAGGFMLICRSEDNRFLRWVLQSNLLPYYRGAFDTTTINRLSASMLGNMLIPWPSKGEREQIAKNLSKVTESIDAVIDTKRRQLDVLKRRRQSLIYEYVTGKRRVGTKG